MSIVTAGSSDISLFFFIVEDVGGTNPGEPKTGLTHSDLDSAYFTRIRSTTTQITPLSTLAAANSSHSDGGFKEIDGTNRKGVYRFDPPDAPFVSGVNEVEVGLNVAAAANAIARPLRISILDLDLRTAGADNKVLISTDAQDLSSSFDVNTKRINGNANAAIRLALSAGTMVPGTVDNTALTPTTTQFEADDITEATADHYVGRSIIFTSGALLDQYTNIVDYSLESGRGRFTVQELTEAPGNNDTFLII